MMLLILDVNNIKHSFEKSIEDVALTIFNDTDIHYAQCRVIVGQERYDVKYDFKNSFMDEDIEEWSSTCIVRDHAGTYENILIEDETWKDTDHAKIMLQMIKEKLNHYALSFNEKVNVQSIEPIVEAAVEPVVIEPVIEPVKSVIEAEPERVESLDMTSTKDYLLKKLQEMSNLSEENVINVLNSLQKNYPYTLIVDANIIKVIEGALPVNLLFAMQSQISNILLPGTQGNVRLNGSAGSPKFDKLRIDKESMIVYDNLILYKTKIKSSIVKETLSRFKLHTSSRERF